MADDKSLLDNNQNHKSIDKENDNAENDSQRMGFRSWRPDWLQHFNSIKWFMVAFCLASFLQGVIFNGITVASIPAIEKEFGLTSKISGLIVTGNDVSAIMLVSMVSFFGTKANKPKWIGIGAIITAFGVMMFALPKLLIGQYEPTNYIQNKTLSLDVCKQNKSMPIIEGCGVKQKGSTTLHIAIFYIAQLIMGAGTTPLFTLGPAYVDENVTPRASPVYLGIWFSMSVMGPGVGMIIGGMFLKTFTNIVLPEGMEHMTADDPRWIGAWWLGYICFSGILLICGFVLILFPKKMLKSGLKRQISIKDGYLPSSDDRIEYTLKGYIKQSLKICTNKVFMLASVGLASKMFFGAGLVTFIAKFLILKFGLLPQNAGIYLGLVMIPTLLVGVLGGSLLLRRIKVELAARTAAKICAIISLITAANTLAFLIPGCRSTNLAGAMVPYHNTSSLQSLSTSCNSECTCLEKNYMPVCGSDGITYHSPCFAGCEVSLKGRDKLPMFGNCSCIPPLADTVGPGSDSSNASTIDKIKTKMSNLFNKAAFGKCDRNCKNFYPFIIIIAINSITQFLSSTPHKIMVLRSVPDNQRSFALGTQFLIIRSLSFLPAPILVGAVIDSVCITWGYNKCGEKQNCYDYDIDKLSLNVALLGIITSVLALICYSLAWWWYPVAADESKEIKELLKENI